MRFAPRAALAMRSGFHSAALLLCVAAAATAHDIPNDATVQAFFRPEGRTLHLLVRAPLKTMRDVVFPERAGYLDIRASEPLLGNAAILWLANYMDVYEAERRLERPRVLSTRISLPSDKSFTSYEEALARVNGARLPDNTDVVWNQTFLDVLFEYPIQSDRSDFAIRPQFAQLALHVVTVLRFLPPGGAVRAFEFPDDPGLIRLDPRWYQAAMSFVVLGFQHILEGTDHLLFLCALVIPFRRFRALVPIVTAFTVAHSVTLIASAYNFGPDALWFPPLIETLIAMSIVYMALENITGAGTVHRRWIITFCFGLVHGFGFSFALRQTLQFAGTHMLTSLLSFNLGVELGQLLVLVLLIPVLELIFRRLVAERMGSILLSAFIAHSGWHWMLERGAQFRQYHLEWPEMNALFFVGVLRWAMAAVALAAAVWLVQVLQRVLAARHAAERRPGDSNVPV